MKDVWRKLFNLGIASDLIELNEENKHLISIASHDLRSPLIRIQSLLSILSSDERKFSIEQKGIIALAQNLLSNAIKFLYPNSNVFVSIQSKGTYISITIKDEGQGLDDEDKKKRFTRFPRLNARPTTGESSTGLGLSIVKKYVEAMKGNIRCEIEKGKGASFIVELPKA